MTVLVKNWKVPAAHLSADWPEKIAAMTAEKLAVPPETLHHAEILSCSIDARAGEPKLLLTVLAECDAPGRGTPATPEEVASLRVSPPEIPERVTLDSPLVVGSGPAGISAALLLAMAGCRPLILDRGRDAERRSRDHLDFLETRELDEESNLLIGEGGAGTFSDGKLYTGTRDLRARWLKQEWVRAGAPAEILWRSRAHIGSDHLVRIAVNLRRRIEELGGRFRFGAAVTALLMRNGRCCGVKLASGETIEAPAVLLACGLGGRELVKTVCRTAAWEFKAFQSGCRIIHPQRLIDRAMYHLPSRPEALGAAEYHLVAPDEKFPVASFCMCPGGVVVNATAWKNHSISNGMSCFDRDGEWANSCLITTFRPESFGNSEAFFAAFDALEERIFAAGGSDYTLPAQSAAAFCARRASFVPGGGAETGMVSARLDELLFPDLRDALTRALGRLDRKLPGFIREGRLIGAESFVSSPVRLLRDPVTMQNPACPGLYPAGEGCGLAGGIVSAACDGLRCAEAMMRNEI